MDTLYHLDKPEEKHLNYQNNCFGEIKHQYDYKFSLYQHLKFSKHSNKKVFKAVNIILFVLTILIGLMFLRIGYKADLIVRVSMVLFIRFFGLLMKIAIFILDKPFFKTEIRENGIIIYYRQNVGKRYDLKEISNIDMEKYYDGKMPSIKFAISDKAGIKHYYYRPSDDIIEKFCNDSILYCKKKNINIKIPIDNREPISYETNNSIFDYWLLLSEYERWEVEKYLWKGIGVGVGISLFVTIMISLAGDGSESRGGGPFLFTFLIFFTIFASVHIVTFFNGFKYPSVEIKENTIVVGKPNLSYDYIKCSSIEDARYKYFKKKDVEGIKLAIIADGKGYTYTWLRNREIEKFCNDIVDIAKNNKEYYSRINSSD